FIYDPITSKLGPLPWDGFDENNIYDRKERIFRLADSYHEPTYFFWKRMFADLEFKKKYLSYIEEVTAPGYVEKMLDQLKEPIAQYHLALKEDYPLYPFARDHQELINNAKLLRDTYLNPLNALTHHPVQKTKDSDMITLMVANKLVVPIEVTKLTVGDRSIEPVNENILTEIEYKTNRLHYQTFKIPNTLIHGKADIKLTYNILGTSFKGTYKVKPF
ncbi:hypothetical protein COV16_06115, partial [Candidatus Woesearchaeota archaeon CG10_big_fil_rev_8_21_14_0_10_34_8]